jgi:hypothetical protein
MKKVKTGMVGSGFIAALLRRPACRGRLAP